MPNSSLRQPAEWEVHESCWVAWPSAEDLWQANLADAQSEFAVLCRAIADIDPHTGQRRGEQLNVLIPDSTHKARAQEFLGQAASRYFAIPFGDIWMRDIAPIFVHDRAGRVLPMVFRFNGWGGKYVLPHDSEVATEVARAFQEISESSGFTATPNQDWILEGGSIDVDGLGTVLTTRQCLLNPNRNPLMTESDIEHALAESLGATKVLWLESGLINDHTDGHIDTLARFIAPGVVMCMRAQESDDPNRGILEDIARDLRQFRDARGHGLEVIEIPSPGKVLDSDGRILPASYVNFYISNTSVIVPTYGSRWDDIAVQHISMAFPGRKTVGLSARAILSGGGAFHCITQQQPVNK